MTRAIRAVLFEPVPAWPLAAFRIAFSTVLLLELLHFVSRWDLVLVAHPLRETLPPGTVAALIAWAIALVAVLLGVLTPVAAAVNHHFVCAFFRPDATFSYHADMLYVPASLLLVFVPCYRCWSVDRVLLKRLLRLDVAGRPVPRVYQHVLVFWVMGFMYFDSTVYKLHSPFWVHGLGFWLPASFPSFTVFSWNSLLNCQWLVRAAGHVTLVFELVFIFVFWSRRLRPLLIGLGLALHIGIAVVSRIPLSPASPLPWCAPSSAAGSRRHRSRRRRSSGSTSAWAGSCWRPPRWPHSCSRRSPSINRSSPHASIGG